MTPCTVIDVETGVGIYEGEDGEIKVVGGHPDTPERIKRSLATILSIWKYGLVKCQADEDGSDGD